LIADESEASPSGISASTKSGGWQLVAGALAPFPIAAEETVKMRQEYGPYPGGPGPIAEVQERAKVVADAAAPG
jgi:hypothetical protein